MRTLKPCLEVITDNAGNSLSGLNVFVSRIDGLPTVLYGDINKVSGPIGTALVSDAFGYVKFWADDGIYRLSIRRGTEEVAVRDVSVGSGDPEDVAATGFIFLGDFLNASATNGNEAILAAFDTAADRYASGRYKSMVIECQGLLVPVTPGLVLAGAARNVTLRNSCLRAGPGSWAIDPEDPLDAADIAFFERYQTLTASGKAWELRKPIFTLTGNNHPNFTLENPLWSGLDAAGIRQAASLRVRGGSSIGKQCIGGRMEDFASYPIFVGEDVANKGDIDVHGTRFISNGNSTAAERGSYGIVLAGNDMHWMSVTSNYSHCPLLVGQYGATTFFTDLDLFNGGVFDPGDADHRLMEYHGNSCTFNGGRWGNGQPHIHNPDLQIFAPKFGVTNGWLSRPATYFVFHASKVNDDLENFGLMPGEMPIAMRDGSLKLFGFVEEGGNTWRAGIRDTMERQDGYTHVTSGKTTEVCQGTGAVVRAFEGTGPNGAMIETRAADTDFNKKAAFGNIGNTAVLQHGGVTKLLVTADGSVQISGRVDGITPPAGAVGERIQAFKTSSQDVTLTSGTVASIASITLTPGEWDVTGSLVFVAAGASGTALAGCLSATTAAIVTTDAEAYASRIDAFTTATGALFTPRLGPLRSTSENPVTLHLAARATFSAGSMSAYGRIQARRKA